MAFIDIQFLKDDTKGYNDIAIDSNGDLVIDESWDTALQISIGTNARASDTEVRVKEKQQGWIGNLAFDDGFNYGSKLWLLEQARLNLETINNAKSYVRNCLEWLVRDNFARNITVNAVPKSNGLEISTVIETIDGAFDNYRFIAWENSIYR